MTGWNYVVDTQTIWYLARYWWFNRLSQKFEVPDNKVVRDVFTAFTLEMVWVMLKICLKLRRFISNHRQRPLPSDAADRTKTKHYTIRPLISAYQLIVLYGSLGRIESIDHQNCGGDSIFSLTWRIFDESSTFCMLEDPFVGGDAVGNDHGPHISWKFAQNEESVEILTEPSSYVWKLTYFLFFLWRIIKVVE